MSHTSHTSHASLDIHSIKYQGNILFIRFTDYSLYAYFDVPELKYKHIISAPSCLDYFNLHIKNIYASSRMVG